MILQIIDRLLIQHLQTEHLLKRSPLFIYKFSQLIVKMT